MNQVKFHISSSSYLLPVFIFSSIRSVFSFFNNGNIGLNKRVVAGFSKIHPKINIIFLVWALIAVKNTSDTSSFIVTVKVHKIFITNFFEFVIKRWVKSITNIFISLMKMFGVFFK